ncbi:MAG: MFS transporter [Myxococcota bacterium]|nr:MFS transporter [Myxococcota bacterium]
MTAEPPPAPVRFQDIFLHRPFLVLWTAFLISSAGTYLFVIVLAGRIYAETGSALMASSVFAAQWLLPVMLSKVVGRICSSYRIRSIAVIGELLSASISIACAFAFDLSFASMLACVMLRGFFESLTRTARTVALKQYVDPRYLEKASSLFGTSMYLSSGFGAVLGTMLAERLTFLGVAAVDAGTFVVAALLYFGIQAKPPVGRKASAGGSALATFRRYPDLFRISFYLYVISGVYQGFHNVARTALPMKHLGLDITGATNLQLVSAFGIVGGAVFVFRFMSDRRRTFARHPLFLIAITSFAMPVPFLTHDPMLSFASYCLFIFLFEVAFTRVNNEIIVTTPIESMGYVAAFNQGCNTALMAIVIVGASAAIDASSVQLVTCVLASAALVAGCLIARGPFSARSS